MLTEIVKALPWTDRSIDLSGVAFLDADGAIALHDAVATLRAGGQTVALTGARPIVRRLWNLCGLDPAFLAA